MSDKNYWLRLALEGSRFTNKKLTVRIAKLRAAGATLTKLPFDEAANLRNVLRRSRRQKTTIKALARKNARLRRAITGTRCRIEILEAQLAKPRAAGSVLSKTLYRRKREQQDRPRSERKRATKNTTRRRMHASANNAGNPMRRTAPRNPSLSRSTSRRTSA